MINGKEKIFVWEDTYLEVSQNTISFRVKMNGVTIYQGVAEAFPDGRPIRIYINRIACEYLYNSDFNPSVTGVTSDGTASAVFSVVELTESNGVVSEGSTLGSIIIAFGFDGDLLNILSEPIDGKADVRMSLPITIFSESGMTMGETEPDTGSTSGTSGGGSSSYQDTNYTPNNCTWKYVGRGPHTRRNGETYGPRYFWKNGKYYKEYGIGVVLGQPSYAKVPTNLYICNY